MNERRKDIVRQAFRVLDITGKGSITADDVKDRYNVDSHPDFASGKKTRFECLNELLQVFEVDSVDGKVTEDEFLNYYHNISTCIDNDDYFELMIRNGWHISGGEGQAANTANTRVLVTNDDGSQEVVEVALWREMVQYVGVRTKWCDLHQHWQVLEHDRACSQHHARDYARVGVQARWKPEQRVQPW